MSKILVTMPEDLSKTNEKSFGIKNNLGGGDHIQWSNKLVSLENEVFYVNWNNLKNGEFTRMYNFNEKTWGTPEKINDMDLIFIYKQENFVNEKERFFSMLERFNQSGAAIINDPKTIEMNLSKEYMIELGNRGVNVIPTYRLGSEVEEKIKTGQPFIVKPKIGERGLGMKKVYSLEDMVDFKDKESYLAQEFLPSIREGERSLGFVGKDYSHSVIKMPNPKDVNEYKCNKSRGGIVNSYNPTSKEIDFSYNILSEFENMGFPVHYSRVDIAKDAKGNPILVEAELLNPSIFANDSGNGDRFGDKFGVYINKLAKENRK